MNAKNVRGDKKSRLSDKITQIIKNKMISTKPHVGNGVPEG
jgi:hypothetical protein